MPSSVPDYTWYISTSRCILDANEEIEICQARLKVQPHTSSSQLVMLEIFAFFASNLDNIQHYSLFPSLLFGTYEMMHACGVRVVFLEHGALGICKSSVVTKLWTSVRFISVSLFYSSL